MIAYPHLKKHYIAKTIVLFSRALIKYNSINAKLRFYEKRQIFFSQKKNFKKNQSLLKQEKDNLFKKFVNPKKALVIYKKNTCVPYILLKRTLHVYRGDFMILIRLTKFSHIIKKFRRLGELLITKESGCLIHKNNKIYRKLKKKMKQLAAKALQRKARKKKLKRKSSKKK